MATQAIHNTATCDGAEHSLIDSIARLKKAMTVDDFADMMNISVGCVYGMVKEKRIPFFRVGSSIRFDPKSLADWLRASGGA